MEIQAAHRYQLVRPRRLLDSVTIVIIILVVVLLVAMGIIFSQITFDIVDKQTQKRAIQTAQQFAALPAVQSLLENPASLVQQETLLNILHLQTELTYLVIVGQDGTIVYHPDPGRAGTAIDDPLQNRALKYGSSYSRRIIDKDRRLIQGTVPVTDNRYTIIGMVSAAYPLDTIHKTTDSYLEKIVFFVFVFITLGLVAAIFIAKGVKWSIFGLEPTEIAHMFQERAALIEAIREGIISTDRDGRITLVNQAAVKTLNLHAASEMIGQHLDRFFPSLDVVHLLATGEPVDDREFVIKGVPIIVNVEVVGQQRGLVVTFRRKEDIDMIARELSQVRNFSGMLRAQTHEYSNSLHTIVGLLQIGAHDEALKFIAQETGGHRKLIRFLAENLPDKILSSMVIGKHMFASEQRITFTIDPESRMVDIPDWLDRNTLTTALGNIIDNGFEAAGPGGKVSLSMSDFGHDLVFEVEDNGPGIPEILTETLFERGVSGKSGADRGFGLYLAQKSITTLGGAIYFETGEAGTIFEIIIPKSGAAHAGS